MVHDMRLNLGGRLLDYNHLPPDVDLKIYSRDRQAYGAGHDIPGLIVALPGKASLMFELARQVADLIR